LKVGIEPVASVVTSVAAELVTGTAAPASIASTSDGQQKAEDPQNLVVPQDMPGTLEDFSEIDHVNFSFFQIVVATSVAILDLTTRFASSSAAGRDEITP
jgi:hypothetical protein